MIKAVAILVACALSLLAVLPWLGAHEYAIWAAITAGVAALAIGMYGLNLSAQMAAAGSQTAGLVDTTMIAVVGGAVAGLFWPTAIAAFLIWLNLSEGVGRANLRA